MKPSGGERGRVSPEEMLLEVLRADPFRDEGPLRRWAVDQASVDRMMAHPAGTWLPLFEKHAEALRDGEQLNILFHLSGYVLEESGADFIRKRRVKWCAETLRGMAFAAIQSLSSGEAYGLITDQLARMDHKERLAGKFVLGWLESRRVLDWMEENIESPVDISWGALAARSNFNWEYLEKWLAMGRPLSLAALDALEFCLKTPKAPDGHQYKPLMHPPSEATFREVLGNYRKTDPAVRVERTIDSLLSARGSLFGQ